MQPRRVDFAFPEIFVSLFRNLPQDTEPTRLNQETGTWWLLPWDTPLLDLPQWRSRQEPGESDKGHESIDLLLHTCLENG